MLKKYGLLLCAFGIMLIMSCTNDRPIQGFDLIDPDDLGQAKSVKLRNPNIALTFNDTLTATGQSGLLMLGAFDNFRSKILMRWENLALVEDEVISATLILTTRRVLGPKDRKTSFRATIHKVTKEWDENTVTPGSFANAFEPNTIGSGDVLNLAEMTVGDSLAPEQTRISLTPEAVALVNQWRDTTGIEHRRGIVLDFVNADFMKAYEARTAVNRPRLEMITALSETERDTLLFAPTGDAYLVEKTGTLPAGPLYVDHISSQQVVLKFDIDRTTIPRESVVNQAVLNLRIDRQNSTLTNAGFGFQVLRLLEEFEPPSNFKIDSTFAPQSFGIAQTATSVAIPVGNLMQAWISTRAQNHGLLIRTSTPGLDISRLAFIADTDPTNGPAVQLEFSVAPGQGSQ